MTNFLLVYTVLFTLASSVYAQDTTFTSSALVDLAIEVEQQDKSVTAPMDIAVIVTNLTDKELKITKVDLVLPRSISSIRNDQAGKGILNLANNTTISPNSKAYWLHFLDVNRASGIRDFFDLDRLMFLPGIYTVKGIVSYEYVDPELPDSMVKGDVVAGRNVELDPPLNSLLVGGMIGALMLATFIVFNDPGLKREHDEPLPKYCWRVLKSVWFKIPSVFEYFLKGLISSWIAILLLQRISDIDLPIAIEVKDWIGGLIVGLFSYKIGKALFDMLLGIEPAQTD